MAEFNFHTTGKEIVEIFQDRVISRTFLITGTSPEGLGAETALTLAKANPKLLLLATRSEAKVLPVIDEILRSHPHVDVKFIELDLANQASIRAAAGKIQQLNIIIDVLINNAAVMACPLGITVDGIETQFGTNQVGPFLFTNLLLEGGRIATGGRIVNVSSSASVRKASVLLPPLDDLTYDYGQNYNPSMAYSVSKLSNMLYARQLAGYLRKDQITVFSVDPGSIKTSLQRYFTEATRSAAIEQAKRDNPDFVMPVRKSLQQGCATQLRAALDPELARSSGAYLQDSQIVEHKLHVECYPAAEKVWKICETLVGETFDFAA